MRLSLRQNLQTFIPLERRAWYLSLAYAMAGHLGILAFLFSYGGIHNGKPKDAKPIAIHTVMLQQPSVMPKEKSKPLSPSVSAALPPKEVSLAKPTVKPPDKSPVKPAPDKSPVKPASKDISNKTPNPQRQKLIDKAKASLKSIPPQISFSVKTDEKIDSHSLSSYQSLLAQQLKQQLKLPEYGSVTVSFTIDQRGRVQYYEILSTTSPANSKYISQLLPTLFLPSFSPYFKELESYQATVTLISSRTLSL